MYEFLDEDMSYDRLNVFQKHKADWLEEMDRYSDATKRAYWINLNTRVNYIEVNTNKDLYNWDKQEIIRLIKNTPTKAISTKISLFTTVSMYINWAYERGFNFVGNPCDSIDTSELFIINNIVLKESYQNLQEFYNFIFGLNCSDVDRAMATILRYGATVDEVGLVKWEDIDRKNKVLNIHSENGLKQLPIDNLFIMMIDKAKMCTEYSPGQKLVTYIDYGYIVKATPISNWQTIPAESAYNKLGEISRRNKIGRIGVGDLRMARKYDLLFEILDENGKVTNYDIDNILKIVDGKSEINKIRVLRMNFELISGAIVEKMKNKK